MDDPESKNLKMKVVGHEGRARCIAFNSIQPTVPIPVHFIVVGWVRARHINAQIVSMLNAIIRDQIKSIWLNGKHISL